MRFCRTRFRYKMSLYRHLIQKHEFRKQDAEMHIKEQNEGCPEQGNESVDQNRKDLRGAEVKIY